MPDPIDNIHEAGMLFDGVQFGFADVGDDIGDASDLAWLGSVTSLGGLGFTRPTQLNSHTGRATSAAGYQAAYLISPIANLKEVNIEAVLHAGMALEDFLEAQVGKEMIVALPIQEGFTTGTVVRVPGEITDSEITGSMGNRLMVRFKLTPKSSISTVVGTPVTP